MYNVDNPGLLTVLNKHVMTDVLEEASLKAEPNFSAKRSVLTFNTNER